MISDKERQEVARRLRELHPEDRCWFGIHGFDWFMFADSLFDAIGCNGIRNWTDYLADLVEPSETIHVDRQKLLALADEMDEVAQRRRSMGYEGFAIGDEDRAHRIREALGVDDG